MAKKRLFNLQKLGNYFELSGVVLALAIALFLQIAYREMPCPLCLLQRLGLFMVAFGFLLNLKFGSKPLHYTVILLSALFTSFVSLRQIALHVVPGTGAYGKPFLGLHLYTWVFIISMLLLVGTSLLVGLQKLPSQVNTQARKKLVNAFFVIVVVLLSANIFGVFTECGLAPCPDNPVKYKWHRF